ncbi:MAG: adenine phosphoribosyltransferase [Defluviitaleaceae bacterium]|nr:adenine phosphoribosyltransferase [Defluviitaleaceae bacterium]MCL2836799.1 adenine phosphoribosyltransferase [Defluviitaleaceae bacterium]
MDLKDRIRDIPDFPQQGILFRDITPLLYDPAYFRQAVNMMKDQLQGLDFDIIAGPESRGFVFGTPLAYLMEKPFIPVRKAGKLPYKTRRAEYELEYGTAVVEMHEDTVKPGDRVVIVDDLLATGGTARAICNLVEELGGEVAAMIFLIELEALGGRSVLGGYELKTLINY